MSLLAQRQREPLETRGRGLPHQGREWQLVAGGKRNLVVSHFGLDVEPEQLTGEDEAESKAAVLVFQPAQLVLCDEVELEPQRIRLGGARVFERHPDRVRRELVWAAGAEQLEEGEISPLAEGVLALEGLVGGGGGAAPERELLAVVFRRRPIDRSAFGVEGALDVGEPRGERGGEPLEEGARVCLQLKVFDERGRRRGGDLLEGHFGGLVEKRYI